MDPKVEKNEDPMEPTLDLILFLKDVALFEALSNHQLVAVARLADPVTLPAGQRLFSQGDAADAKRLLDAATPQLGCGEIIVDEAIAKVSIVGFGFPVSVAVTVTA